MKANSRRTWKTKRPLLLVVAAICCLGLLWLLPTLFGAAAALVYTPVLEVKNWVQHSGAALPSYLRDRGELVGTITRLEEQLTQHGGDQGTISRLQTENEELRSLLNDESAPPRILAAVLALPPATPYDVVVLDKGSADGIVKHAPVFVADDQVVGYVASVSHSSATVVLASTPGVTSTVYVFGPNIYTTAEGIGNGVLRLNVPQGIDLEVGNAVVMPALYPGVYGEVTHVESVPSRPEQYGFVTLPTPLRSFRLVSVGSDPLPEHDFPAIRDVVDTLKSDRLEVSVPSGVLVDVDTSTSTATSTPPAAVDRPL